MVQNVRVKFALRTLTESVFPAMRQQLTSATTLGNLCAVTRFATIAKDTLIQPKAEGRGDS